ncbi:AAA family ATPase [Alteromonas sp. McT4-15]|uniref:AAA family ATPase n=1 Tax=Alteromonas sp. McT4-15 TaxID=2881256 RepID=UPI001CF86226|nr:AAA family ATPase [Alteromonas sp. McT4-15]MCB4436986.1 AAA family ATPase [Alteromonas sp. McT4-15]
MKLISVELTGSYKGLHDSVFDFSESNSFLLAFIGLNGCGKSQLLELIAESFAFIERYQRREFKVRKPLGFDVAIEYQLSRPTNHSAGSANMVAGSRMAVAEGIHNPKFKVNIQTDGDVKCYIDANETWQKVGIEELTLPDYIVGYSSGLNENLQRAFLKNAVQYFDVMNTKLKWRKELAGELNDTQMVEVNEKYLTRYPHIFDAPTGEALEQDGLMSLRERPVNLSQLVYLDYDSAGLVVASLAMLDRAFRQEVFDQLRFKHPSRLVIEYDLRGDLGEEESIRDIRVLIRIAGRDNFEGIGKQTTDTQFDLYELDYLHGKILFDFNDVETLSRLREENYSDPVIFFARLYKLQQLGAKNWRGVDRTALRRDDFLGTVKKPLKSKLPLTIRLMELADDEGEFANYDDLSDGEAQLLQTLACLKVFSQDPSNQRQALFLFDEPETHYNPAWRTYFHKHIKQCLGGDISRTKLLMTSHSPFMVSSLKQENVYFFERDEQFKVHMKPSREQTYGASFDILIKQFFGLRSLISQTVVDEIRKQLEQGDAQALEWIRQNLGSSPEKAYLLRKLG